MSRSGLDLNLIICVPNNGMWLEPFAMNLIHLVLGLQRPIPGVRSIQADIYSPKGSILNRSRQRSIERAVKQEATHLLFIDSDQTFPADTFQRLFKWQKKVVAANIATKSEPSYPTARGFQREPVYTKQGQKGLEKVWRIGTGVMLLDMSIFHGLDPWPQPLFDTKWNPELNDYQGEDWGFCEWLERRNIPLYVDHGLSWEIGHIGPLVYGHDLVHEELVNEARNRRSA